MPDKLSPFCRHCGRAVNERLPRCGSCGMPLNGYEKRNGQSSAVSNRVPKDSPDEMVALALQLASQEAVDDAIRQLKRAIKANPDFVPAWALLGELYARIGEKEKALESFERALSLDKDYEPARLGKEALLNKATEEQPVRQKDDAGYLWAGHPFPLLVATFLALSLLFGTRAVITRRSAVTGEGVTPPITLAPSPPSVATAPPAPPQIQHLLQKGFAAFNEGRFGDALNTFRQALQIDPASQEARAGYFLAEAAIREQREPGASRLPSATTARRPRSVVTAPPTGTLPPLGGRAQGEGQRSPLYLPAPLTNPNWIPTPQAAPQAPQQQPIPQLSQSPERLSPDPFVVTPAPAPSPRPEPTTPPTPRISPERLEREAQDLIWAGRYAEAEEKLRTLLSIGVPEGREGDIRQQLALTLQRLGRYSEAASEYERAIVAYQRQLERGINISAAQKGIEVCRQGLEVCRRAQ
ncbi:MAG: tetratricopeptide repeat protein [Armatimonadetes bacterium]|nr:tetratricopeptide repeat protein [Armatimonadota bacterium]MDW8122230.1 tetratricopeptide repeat protein [Armatimonadota bacterium]